MDVIVEALQGIVMAEPEPEAQPVPNHPGDVGIETKLNDEIHTPAQPAYAAVETELTGEMQADHPEFEPAREDEDVTAENQLTAEISELWTQHTQLSGTRRLTAKELRILRAKLSEKLHAMKQLLCRVGRSGQWRGYLREQHIPRTTADRLCERYSEILATEGGNPPTGAINEAEDTVEQLVHSLLPRLKRTLSNTQAVFHFLSTVGQAFGLKSETSENCIMVSQPKEQSEPSPSATGAQAASAEVTVPGAENSSDAVVVQAETAETCGGGE
jgi:hypothetical protein